MAYGRVGVDVFQVGLYHGTEGTVYDRDGRQHQEEVTPNGSSGRHQVHGDTEASVTSQFHQYTGVQHTYGRRGRSMTVGAPCMEGEEGAQYTKSQEDHREEDALHLGRYLVFHDF